MFALFFVLDVVRIGCLEVAHRKIYSSKNCLFVCLGKSFCTQKATYSITSL